jgi:hypothetical protein
MSGKEINRETFFSLWNLSPAFMLLRVEVIIFNLKDNEISLQMIYKLHLNIRYLITFSLS